MSNTHRGRVIVVEPGAVATVLPGHITHEATKGSERLLRISMLAER